jgi:hypothetical protein
MSVYELDIKGLRKTFMKFHKTLYGRTIFFLAYIIPALLFIAGIAALIAGIIKGCQGLLLTSASILIAFVVTFVIGNIYFYSEIRKFCKYEDHKKK